MPPAIGGDANASDVLGRIISLPHLGTRQIVHAAERAPDQVLHLGVEFQPVGRIAPAIRHAFGRCLPGCAAVEAVESADVGVVDEDVLRVERIEVNAIVCGDVEPARGPAIRAHPDRVHLSPAPATVECAVGAEQIGRVNDVRIAGRDTQAGRSVEPDVFVLRLGPLFDVRRIKVGGGACRFAKDDGPVAAGVGGLRDAVVESSGCEPSFRPRKPT